MAKFELILLSIFIPFLTLDLFILYVAAQKNLTVENRYYKFHQRYGVKRTSILKIVFGVLVVISLVDPPLNIGKLYLVVLVYFGYTAWLFVLILSALPTKSDEQKYSFGNPLDSLAGFLVYPFEYLDTKKHFYVKPPQKLKWSWGAFCIPEYWYFSNEILGAGYLSWALLFAYLGLFLASSLQIALLSIISIRIFSGFFGQELYYAKYGKWA